MGWIGTQVVELGELGSGHFAQDRDRERAQQRKNQLTNAEERRSASLAGDAPREGKVSPRGPRLPGREYSIAYVPGPTGARVGQCSSALNSSITV